MDKPQRNTIPFGTRLGRTMPDECCASEPVERPSDSADACDDDCCRGGAAVVVPSESGCADGCCDDDVVAAAVVAPAVVVAGPVTVPTAAATAATTAGRASGAVRSVVRVTGMDCASCAVTIEKRVGALAGVDRATVNFAAGRLDVDHAEHVGRADLVRAVEAAGYGVEDAGDAEPVAFWSQPKVVCTMIGATLFAVAALLGLAGVADPVVTTFFAAASLIGGLPIYRSALSSLRVKVADVNVLMSLAVVGASIIGAWGEAALVVLLFSLSNALQVYAVGRTRRAVRALARLTPDEILVRRGGLESIVASAEVRAGDTVIVRPGERIAIDGRIVEGSSALDESPVTGESTPVEKGPGEHVFSGSLNGPGGLVVEATKSANDSTLQRITRMVEDAQSTKAPIEQFVARFARVYTPVVLITAVLVATVPLLFGGEFSTWFYRALVLLIVSCPCALVISTPVSVVSGIGAASRRGILIKGGEALEAAGKLTTLFFDKTGTLTEGRPVVERLVTIGDVGESEVLRLAAALERRSEHPLAHAILTAAGEVEPLTVTGFTSVAGRGAQGEIDGHRLVVGSPRMFDELGLSLEAAGPALKAVEEAGETPVILGRDGQPIAVFGVADAIRPDAVAALASLRRLGVERLVMLTGDAEAPARRIADQLDIEFRAQLLPEDKVAAVKAAAEHEKVGMVGDGINDAPALAAADVSFAMGAAGTDAALEAADIALMADDLFKLGEAIELSRSASRTIRQNIAVSLVLNTAFTVLAPLGLIPLWLAVAEDAVTSTGVTANSLRLFRFKGGARRADVAGRPAAGAGPASLAAQLEEIDTCCAPVRTS